MTLAVTIRDVNQSQEKPWTSMMTCDWPAVLGRLKKTHLIPWLVISAFLPMIISHYTCDRPSVLNPL